LPQFHWLANLSRYLRKDTKIRLRNFKDFGTIANIDFDAFITAPSKEFEEALFKDNTNIELWLFLDNILLDLSGQEMSWLQLLNHYQYKHPDIVKHVLSFTFLTSINYFASAKVHCLGRRYCYANSRVDICKTHLKLKVIHYQHFPTPLQTIISINIRVDTT
jgi:hypothetical protein